MKAKQQSQLLLRILSVSTILLLALTPLGGAHAKAPAIYSVNTTDDINDGACNKTHCSLREAINDANAHPGSDRIEFKIRGGPPYTIQPLAALPEITDPVTIDGTNQPGFRVTPIVELDGTNAGEEASGLVISAGNSLVRGLVINRFSGDGVVLTSSGANTIQGNFIGTDVTGAAALGNFRGVVVQGGSSGNFIGGEQSHTGNLLSGNAGAGVRLSDVGTEGNKVQGNFIGTDLTGMRPLGNNLGVRIVDGAANNLIGGTKDGARNIISGNNDTGIYIDVEDVEGTTGNIVQGNYIGTDASGAAALPNCDGVWIGAGATNTLIGGVEAGAGNLVSGNGGDGVSVNDTGTTGTVVQGNFIGTDASGAAALPNGADGVRILGGASNTLIGGTENGARNLISGNTYIGVSIWDTGTSKNIIQGNYIGTDLTGTQPLGNFAEGVSLFTGASDNLISGNLISANMGAGVKIADPETTGNKVQGNFIGTDASGAAALPNGADGVRILGGATNTLIGGVEAGAGNLVSGNGGDGVSVNDTGTTGTVVQGNFIGTDASGAAALPNGADGVRILGGASNTLIGGTENGARNFISGNTYIGISIWDTGTSDNIVQGNYIGTDLTGTQPLGNSSSGVSLSSGTTNNLISANLISANMDAGVRIADPGTTGNKVQSNFIGTDINGTSPLGNVFGIGITDGAADNVIGGTEDGAGNVISGNILWGALIYGEGVTGNLVQGNFIGTDASGTMDLGHLGSGVFIGYAAADNLIGGTEPDAGNTIAFNGVSDAWAGIALGPAAGSGNALLSNSVFSNGGLGIDLNNDTFVTHNDPLDQDAGPNDLQNYPVITAVRRVGISVMIYGTLNSTPSTRFRLEFFSNETCDPSGYGEGQAFLGSADVKTSQTGKWSFIITLPVSLPQGGYVTATATNPGGSTSEFSACVGG